MAAVRFDQTVTTAQYQGKVNSGFIKVWGFFPFWISKTRSVEQQQPNPTGANLEVRDGIYIKNDPTVSGSIYPVVMPWTGEVWLFNSGAMPGESLDNFVMIDLENQCG